MDFQEAEALDLCDEGQVLKHAQDLYSRYTCDLSEGGDGKARTRLIAGIQIAMREAFRQGMDLGAK